MKYLIVYKVGTQSNIERNYTITRWGNCLDVDDIKDELSSEELVESKFITILNIVRLNY